MSRHGFDAGRGGETMLWGTVHCQSELQAALRCIPSTHVQPKHLMSSESAERTDHFDNNNAPSVCHSALPTPLVLSFHLSVALPWGRSCEDRSGGSAPHLTLVRFTVQQTNNHPIPISEYLVSVTSALRVQD